MGCECSCPKSMPNRQELWCRACYEDWLAWIDDQITLARIAELADRMQAIPPATAEEWRRHLDEVAPTVEELAA